MARATAFIAHGHRRSFTACASRSPRSHGHLTHCLSHRHDAGHSLPFGPSSLASASSTCPVTTMAAADFSLRLDTVALSGMRRDLPYMDAPGLPSSQSVTTRGKDCTRTFGLLLWPTATAPDGMCWLVPQSGNRTRGAWGDAGLTNHGLTCLPSLPDRSCNRWSSACCSAFTCRCSSCKPST